MGGKGILEFEAGLVYIVISKTARTAQVDPVCSQIKIRSNKEKALLTVRPWCDLHCKDKPGSP